MYWCQKYFFQKKHYLNVLPSKKNFEKQQLLQFQKLPSLRAFLNSHQINNL
jgi:hypothetical protein